jgi:uncharacterized integral membrane protein (TIGR00698 family)
VLRDGVIAAAWLRLPGFGLACVLALAATFVSTMHGGPQMLYALLLGVAFHYLNKDAQTRPGIEFCSRSLLRLGVGLLGARITASQIAGLGWTTAAIVVLAVVSTLLFGYVLARRLRMTHAQGVLSGGAVAICGASAALAISAVLPRDKESERFTLMVVVTVTVLSTIAMVLYPLIARVLNLPPELAGLFLGGTIHDVAQVAGAGYMLNHETGDYAVIVKLFRVSMLAVVVVVVSAMFRSQREVSEKNDAVSPQKLVPWFLWLFIALLVLNSAGGVPAPVQDGLNWISRACLVVAIVALGMKTSIEELRSFGWRPLALLLSETLWIAVLVLILVQTGAAA